MQERKCKTTRVRAVASAGASGGARDKDPTRVDCGQTTAGIKYFKVGRGFFIIILVVN